MSSVRLVLNALLEYLASEPHTRLRYFCSPQHTDSAFYPFREPRAYAWEGGGRSVAQE